MKKLFLALGIFLAAAAGCVGGALWLLSRGLPQVMALEEYHPASATRIYAADSALIAEFAVERRHPVPFERIPKNLIYAVLAIEDHRYFEHHGVNVARILKALAVDILAGRAKEGGSTITQQLAKVLFLSADKTIERKVREAILAFQIEQLYTKEEILGFYLNQIYLGNGAYGAGAAAEVYFGKDVSALTLAECALIAALPRAPSLYDPFRAPDRAKERRNLVLRRMETLGWATAEEAARAVATPLPASRGDRLKTSAPYFVETVRQELVEALGQDLVYRGGLQVHTTLDPTLQAAAEKALAAGLGAVNQRNPGRKSRVQGAVLALDPATGAVVAHVGGDDWAKTQFDRARQAKRQMGSAFKPVVYAAALEAGGTQADRLDDSPARYPGARPDEPWEPQNYDREFMGSMTARKALALSRNLPAIRLAERIGVGAVEAMATRLGLEGVKNGGLAVALGVGNSTLEKTTAAYAAFVAGGLRPEPFRIRSVLGPDGRSLWEPPPTPRRSLSPETAYVLSDMLREVVDSGTAKAARALPFVTAGKTGTTDDQRDASFIGFSSRLALGVWVGRDDMSPIGVGETGARAALPVWIDVMYASADRTLPPPWTPPENTVFVKIDLVSGLLAGPNCVETAFAAFPRGREPTRTCDRERFGAAHPLDAP